MDDQTLLDAPVRARNWGHRTIFETTDERGRPIALHAPPTRRTQVRHVLPILDARRPIPALTPPPSSPTVEHIPYDPDPAPTDHLPLFAPLSGPLLTKVRRKPATPAFALELEAYIEATP